MQYVTVDRPLVADQVARSMSRKRVGADDEIVNAVCVGCGHQIFEVWAQQPLARQGTAA